MLMTSSGYKLAIGSVIKGGTDGAMLFVGSGSKVCQSLITGLVKGNGTGYVTAVPNQDYAPSVNPTFHGSVQINGATNQTSPLLLLYGQPASVPRLIGSIDGVWANSNDATRLGRVVIRVSDYTGIDKEGFRLESTGSAAAMGFFGAPAVPKPSGDVATALGALGLISNPTTGSSLALGNPIGNFPTDNSILIVGTGGILAETPAIAESQVTNLVSDLSSKASLFSPAFTGVPTVPTPIAGTNTTQIATTAFVLSAVAAAGGGTLTGSGTAGNLAKWSSTTALTNAVAGTDYLVPTGSGAGLTGITAPQVSAVPTGMIKGSNGVFAAATSNVDYLPISSPQMMGTPIAPTPVSGTNTTQVATTAFVLSSIASTTGGFRILTGIGAPTLSLGNDGDFYIATDLDIMYGPRSTTGYGSSVFPFSTGTPNNTYASTGYSLGELIHITVPGRIVALLFWRQGGSTVTSRVLKLWNQSNQALLATSQPTSETPGFDGWVTAPLTTPYVPTNPATLIVSYEEPNGSTFSYTTVPLTSSVSGITTTGGTSGAIGSCPATTGGADHMLDIEWEPVASPWPPALVGGGGSGGGASVTATYILQTVNASLPNSQAISSLSTGLLKGTTGTGVISTAVAGTDYLTPTGSGAGLTNLNASALISGTVPIPRLGASGTPGTTTFLRGDNTWATVPAAGAPTTSRYILQIADGSLPNAQAISSLTTGLLKGTTGTGVISTAVAGTDYLVPTGSGAGLTGITASQISAVPAGIIKGSGGNFVVAAAGTDYLVPIGSGAGLTGITASQISSVPAGMIKGSGGAFVAAVANTDYLIPASPALTGIPTAPTAAPGTSTTQIATTAFVLSSISSIGAPTTATYILQTANASLPDAQVIGSLATGLLKGTTGTGVISTAVAGTDYLTPTGSGAGLTNLNASALASGTVPLARLGTNAPSSTLFLRGDNTWEVAGVGTVTEIDTGQGLTGGPIIGSGIISVANGGITSTMFRSSNPSSLVGNPTTGTASVTDIILGITLGFSGAELITEALTGDVTAPPNSFVTTVVALGGALLGSTTATAGNLLIGSGSHWVSNPVSGDIQLSVTGAATVKSLGGTAYGNMAYQNANAVNITGGIITGMPTPASGSDVATKSYVDSATTGLSAIKSCRLASTINLNATYSNGTSGIGATLTNAGSLASFSLDGFACNGGDRILVKNQSIQSQNGIYTVTNLGGTSVAWVLTRATDWDTSSEINEGDYTVVGEGTVNAGSMWIETGTGPFTVGTTPIIFTQLQTAPLNITLTGDVTGSGAGSIGTTVTAINGVPLGSTAALSGHFLIANGAQWVSQAISGDISVANNGSVTVSKWAGTPFQVTPVTAGNLLIASGTTWISQTISGDLAITSAGVITVTKTNGVAFAPSATIDTTNAGNITSGTLAIARLGTSGTPSSSTFLRGDNTWQVITPVTALATQAINWSLGANTPLTVGTDKTAWAIIDWSCTLQKVNLRAKTPSAGSSIILDIYYSINNGSTWTSLWATNTGNRPTLAAGVNNGSTSAFDTTTLTAGTLLRIDVVQIGSTTAGQDLTVQLEYSWQQMISSGPAGTDTQIQYNQTGVMAGNANLTFNYTTNTLNVPNVVATNLSGSGSAITALNASNLASGTVATARLGTGTASTSTFLRGDGSWQTIPVTTPAGSDQQIQFNQSNAFGASSNLTYNYTSNVLSAPKFSGDGSFLIHLNGSNIDQGMVPAAHLGTGSLDVNHFLAGDNTWQPLTLMGSSQSKYVLNTFDVNLPNAQYLSNLSTGIVKVTNTTGILSTAVAGTDYLTPTGSGAGLTNLNASALASGTVPIPRLGSSGTPGSTTFLRGDGTWAAPSGAASSISIGSPITGSTAGSVLYADSSTSLAQDNTNFNYNATTFTLTVTNLAGSGTGLSNLNASSLASGTVPLARLGTNAPSSTLFLRGDNTWQIAGSGTVTQVNTGVGLVGGPFSTTGTIAVATNGITSALFRQSAALSLVGNPMGSAANVIDITLGITFGFSGSMLETTAMIGDVTTSANSFVTTVHSYNNGTPFGSMAAQNSNLVAITGGTITGMSAPVGGSDVATKSYVDSATSGLSGKTSCRSTSTVNLTATYANGASGIGATLTNSGALAAFAIDGVTTNVNDRILIKNQTFQFQNGIYSVTTVGSASVAWVLTRTTDYNSSSTILEGTYTIIEEGITQAGTLWIQTTPSPITVGTTAIVFIQMAAATQTITLTGDATGSGSGTIATTVTKTNGVAFAPSATIDTTNANNITSGTVATARLGTGTANNTTYLRGDQTWQPAPVTSVATKTGAVSLVVGDVSGAAPLVSPALTGTPTAPTATAGTNTTQIATTAFVLGQGFVTAATAPVTSVANKTGAVSLVSGDVVGDAPLASPTFTGTPAAPTATAGTSTTQIATTAFVMGAGFAPLASPALTGIPTAPTATAGTNTTQIATTAFVLGQGFVTAATAPVTSVATKTGAVALVVADVSGAAPLASPGLTGTPTAPTATAGTNTIQIATTAFVTAAFVPAGSTTQVQFNNAGVFGGSSAFTFASGTGTLTATNLVGAGAAITSLNASNLASGTVPIPRLGSSGTPGSTTFLRGDNTWAAPSGAASSISIGSAVTGGTANGVLYIDSSISLAEDASNLSYNPSTHTFTAINIAGSGTAITSLNASNLGSGTVPLAQLGTNAPSSSLFFRGDNTWQTPPSGTVTQINTGAGLSGGPFSTTGTISVAGNGITAALFRQSVASSLVGNPTPVPANVTDITLGVTFAFSGSMLETIAMTGDVTTSANSFVTTVHSYNNGTAFGSMASQNSTAVAITGGTITGMPTPVGGSDVATKNYVDSATSGLSAKASCRAASTVNLIAAYSPGGSNGPGSTLTNTGTFAPLVMDGVTANVNDRVLIKNMTGTVKNGIFTVTNIGSATVAWVLTRATDYDDPTKITEGTYTIIEEGTQAGTMWMQTTPSPITVSTSPIVFIQMSAAPQTITFTGDVTGSGSGSIATTVAAINGVTLGSTVATAGRLLIGSGTQWVSQALSGDATISGTGAITVTKTGGVVFAPSATIDTTNASNLASGTVPLARLGTNQSVNCVPVMTSNTTPAPSVVTVSSIYQVGYDGFKAFDHNSATFWMSGATPTGYVQIAIGSTYLVASYALTAIGSGQPTTRGPKTWTLQGSTDGVSWTILDTQTNAPTWAVLERRLYSFTNTISYSYYKLNITANQGDAYVEIVELELFAGQSLLTLFLRGDNTWQLPPVTTPAGSDTQVQFNQAGVFGASANLAFNYSTNTFTATNLAGSGTAITALNASNLASGTVPIPVLGASGTPGATTFLRGDNTWAAPSGAASSISIGSAVTGGTANSALYIDSSISLAQDNTNFSYNPTTHTFTAANLAGSGTAITNLNASNLASGTVPTARLGIGTANNTVFLRGDQAWSNVLVGTLNIALGTITSNVNGVNITGTFNNASTTFDAPLFVNIVNTASSGASKLMDLQTGGISVFNVDLLGNTIATSFVGSGSSLTSLNASNLASGTVATARLGSGTANNTTYLRGDGTWVTLSIPATTAKFVVNTADASVPNAQVLSTLSTGMVKVTTGTGLLSTAVAGTDYLVPGGDGSALTGVVTVAGTQTVTGNKTFNGTVTIDAFNGYVKGIAGLLSAQAIPIPAADLGSGTANNTTFLRGDNTWQPISTGGVTSITAGAGLSGGTIISTGTIAIAPGGVTSAMLRNSGASSLIGNPTAGAATPTDISLGSTFGFSSGMLITNALGGDLTSSPNSFSATIKYLAGTPIINMSPAAGNILLGNGTQITSAPMSGDVIISSTGYTTLKTYNGVAIGDMIYQSSGAVSITGGTITGMPTPINGTDVANKNYVDNATIGLSAVGACRMASTVNLTAVYANGASGVGATLTNNGTQAAFAMDGVTGNVGDRVLIKNQTTQFQNGIYSVTTIGSGSVNWVLTRVVDWDTSAEIREGDYTVISEGTANKGTMWIETGQGPFTVGTTSIVFTQLQTTPTAITLTGDVSGSGTGSIATTVTQINGNSLGVTTPTAGGLLVGSGTQWVSHALAGDATISTTGVLTVTATGGHPFVTSAWVDTTNAANITSGTVATARLGTGTASTTTFLRGDNSWQPVITTPGGANMQVQFNNNGILDGNSNLIFNPVNGAFMLMNGHATVTTGTVTTQTNALAVLSTYNNAGVVFSGAILVTVTNSASAPGSMLMVLNTGGTREFGVDLAGNVTANGTYSGSGANLTNLNASNLASGTVPTAVLGTGTANNTTFLRGDSTWQTVSAGSTTLTGDVTGSGTGSIATTVTKTNGVPFAPSATTDTTNATNITTGTVATARLGTGTANNTTYLRGDQTWQAISASTTQSVNWSLGVNTPLTVGTDKTTWEMINWGCTLQSVKVCAKTPSAGASIILDILYSTNGGTTFTSLWATNQGNRPTLAAGSNSGTTSAFDTSTLVAGTLLRIDVIQVGSTTPGQDISVQLNYSWSMTMQQIGPAGSDTQVQYNSAGTLSGSANFTFNNTTNTLTVSNLSGSGSAITGLNASNLVSGTIPAARFPVPLALSTGTITTSTQALSITGTFNSAATNFAAPLLVNITNTASGANSLLFDLQVGGTSVFNVNTSGINFAVGMVTNRSQGNLAYPDVMGLNTGNTLVLAANNTDPGPFLRLQPSGLVSTRGIFAQGTTNLFEVHDSSEAIRFSVGPTGALSVRDSSASPAVRAGTTSYSASVAPFGALATTVAQGRLTCSAAISITTGDFVNIVTLFYLPHTGDMITLYNTTSNVFENVSIPDGGIQVPVNTLAANTNYDVFVQNNPGTTPTLVIGSAWTSDTVRATNLYFNNGMYFAGSGASQNQRWVGTIRTTASAGQIEDSQLRRYCWNAYNQAHRRIHYVHFLASWNLTVATATTTVRPLNGDATARADFIYGGLPGDPFLVVDCYYLGYATSLNSCNFYTSVSIDQTTGWTVNQDYVPQCYATALMNTVAKWTNPGVSVGHHWLTQLEVFFNNTGANQTFYGFGSNGYTGFTAWIMG